MRTIESKLDEMLLEAPKAFLNNKAECVFVLSPDNYIIDTEYKGYKCFNEPSLGEDRIILCTYHDYLTAIGTQIIQEML